MRLFKKSKRKRIDDLEKLLVMFSNDCNKYKAENYELRKKLDKYRFRTDDVVKTEFDSSDFIVVYYKTKCGTILAEVIASQKELDDYLHLMDKVRASILGWRYIPGYKEV